MRFRLSDKQAISDTQASVSEAAADFTDAPTVDVVFPSDFLLRKISPLEVANDFAANTFGDTPSRGWCPPRTLPTDHFVFNNAANLLRMFRKTLGFDFAGDAQKLFPRFWNIGCVFVWRSIQYCLLSLVQKVCPFGHFFRWCQKSIFQGQVGLSSRSWIKGVT